MSINDLIDDHGFKRKTILGRKYFVNKTIDLTLFKVEGEFHDLEGNIVTLRDIILKEAVHDIKESGKRFKAGLPKHYLAQGNYAEVFERNTTPDNNFISHQQAENLLHAVFNYKLCSGLMCSSEGEIFTYRIIKTWYRFSEGTLMLCYEYKDTRSWHNPVITVTIIKGIGMYPINNRLGIYVPLELITDTFL